MRFDPEQPVIVLNVELKGRIIENVKMAFDTGSTYTMIPWKLAKPLGLSPELSEAKVDMVTASGVEKAPLVTLESMTVLGESLNDVQATVHDLPPRSYVDGLLGLSFLKKFDININFKEGVLEIKK